MTAPDDDGIPVGTCNLAVLTAEDGNVRVRPVEIPSLGDVDAEYERLARAGATILQLVAPDEHLICCVPGCGLPATHAVTETRPDQPWQSCTSCPGHLQGVICTVVLGLKPAAPRPAWN